LIAAVAAVIQTGAVRFAFELGNAVYCTAVRAHWTLRPAHRFKVFAGRFRIVVAGLVKQVFSHDVSPMYG